MSSQASIGRTPTPWPLGPEGGLASAAGGIWQADTGPVGHALSGAGVTGGVGGGDFLTRPTADSRREPQYSAAVPATRAGGHSAGGPAVRVHADNTPGGMGSENEDPSAGQKQLVMQLLEAVAQSEQQGAKENKKESRENTPEHVEEITPTQPPLGMVNYIGAPAQPTGASFQGAGQGAGQQGTKRPRLDDGPAPRPHPGTLHAPAPALFPGVNLVYPQHQQQQMMMTMSTMSRLTSLPPSALPPSALPPSAPPPSALSSPTAAPGTSLGSWQATAAAPTTTPLDPEMVQKMLSDQEFRPGARPTRFDAELNCYIFKEGRQYHVRSKAAAGGRSDRWHNSGGAKAARDLPLSQPLVRRRYGSLAQQDGTKYRYHEYCLVTQDAKTGEFAQDRAAVLFHVMLPLSGAPKATVGTGSASDRRSRRSGGA